MLTRFRPTERRSGLALAAACPQRHPSRARAVHAARGARYVVVLAGDIAPGTAGIDWAAAQFAGTPVVYVAGNHEYYGQTLPALNGELEVAAAASDVHPLENGELIVGGVRFLGCTLWSDFEFAGADEREQSMELCERLVNDYGQIRYGAGERRLRAADTLGVHVASRAWLTDRLADPHDGPTVVVTHHAPLIRARPESPIMRAVAGAFASDLSELIARDLADLWISATRTAPRTSSSAAPEY